MLSSRSEPSGFPESYHCDPTVGGQHEETHFVHVTCSSLTFSSNQNSLIFQQHTSFSNIYCCYKCLLQNKKKHRQTINTCRFYTVHWMMKQQYLNCSNHSLHASWTGLSCLYFLHSLHTHLYDKWPHFSCSVPLPTSTQWLHEFCNHQAPHNWVGQRAVSNTSPGTNWHGETAIPNNTCLSMLLFTRKLFLQERRSSYQGCLSYFTTCENKNPVHCEYVLPPLRETMVELEKQRGGSPNSSELILKQLLW